MKQNRKNIQNKQRALVSCETNSGGLLYVYLESPRDRKERREQKTSEEILTEKI